MQANPRSKGHGERKELPEKRTDLTNESPPREHLLMIRDFDAGW